MLIVNCPSCREGEHDECYIIAEVSKAGDVVWCHCWDTQHVQERVSNMT